MPTTTAAEVEEISLQALHIDNPRNNSFELLGSAVNSQCDDIAPQDAAVDLRPSRTYQLLLLLSGFLMIFHIIGINSIYGLFQVRTICKLCRRP